MPGIPSEIIAQSYPGSRRLRVSQPSIHFPRVVSLDGSDTGSASATRFSLAPKNSSLAAITLPPTRSEARSTRRSSAVMDLRVTSGPAPAHPARSCEPLDPAGSSRRRALWCAAAEGSGIDGEGSFRVPHDQVGGTPGGSPPGESDESGRLGAEPSSARSATPNAPGRCRRPHDREPQFEGCDPAPRRWRSRAASSSAGQGEWSLTTMSMVPSARPSQRLSRLAASRIGGAHFQERSPSPISFGGQVR